MGRSEKRKARYWERGWWPVFTFQSVCVCVLICALLCVFLPMAACSREAPRGGPLEVVACFGESGNAPGQFGYPRCIEQDGDSLWVIDKLARVQRLDPRAGRSLEVWRTPKFDNGKPTGVTVWRPEQREAGEVGGRTDQSLLFIADTHEHRILVYEIRALDAAQAGGTPIEQAPKLLGSFGSYGESDGQMVYPTDICVVASPDGRLIERVYVSEYGGNDRISIWEPKAQALRASETMGLQAKPNSSEDRYGDWRFVRSFGTFGDSVSAENVQFSRPQMMTLSDDGRQLVIADACNHRIGVFTLEGALVRWIATQGPGKEPGQLAYPYAVLPLGDGTIMVTEYGNNRLQRLDIESGASLGIFGQQGRGAGQLSTPWGMTRIGDRLYVLDSGNSRIVAISVPRGRPEALSPALAAHQGTTGGGP